VLCAMERDCIPRELLVDEEDVLFAQERENVWRDEVFEFEVYVRILRAMVRSGGMELKRLEEVGVEFTRRLMRLVPSDYLSSSEIFAVGGQTDLFDTITKTFLLSQLLQDYNIHLPLRQTLLDSHIHSYWNARF
jgi:hypothetical protein